MVRSMGEDVNKVFQFDFIGQDVQTGFIKHTFQVGFDWKETTVTTKFFEIQKLYCWKFYRINDPKTQITNN